MKISSSSSLSIADLLRGDLQLASPPNIYFALKKIIDDPDKSIIDASSVIENDAALSVKLLKIVNSAFYGFPRQISSIAKAMSMIGLREIQNLAFSAVMIERFSELPGELFSIHDFWARNLRCALIAREFDAQLGKRYQDDIFLCGLVHNIGQLVFFRRIPLLAREVGLLQQSLPREDPDDEVRLEQRIIGFDHFQTGAELCRLWQLPEIVVESIGLHCFPDNTGPYCSIAAMVRLANCYSAVDTPCDAIVADSLGLRIDQISSIIDKTHHEFEAIFKIFYPMR